MIKSSGSVPGAPLGIRNIREKTIKPWLPVIDKRDIIGVCFFNTFFDIVLYLRSLDIGKRSKGLHTTSFSNSNNGS
jgi:hypothetical protein